MTQPAILPPKRNKNDSTGILGAKKAIREWLIDHFSFIPNEDYERLQGLFGKLAYKAYKLQGEVERLQELLDGREHGK